MDPYEIMMGMILVLTPIICWFFTRSQTGHRIPVRKWAEEFHNKRYYLHAIGYIVIIRWKSITDKLNEPMKIGPGTGPIGCTALVNSQSGCRMRFATMR